MGFFRKKPGKDGKPILYYVWKGPKRQEDGSISHVRFDKSTGTGNIRLAEKKARILEEEAIAAANRIITKKEDVITFARAATIYMEGGGSSEHLIPILERIGEKAVVEITQESVLDLCKELKPGTKPGTWNRCIFTPIIAVITHASKLRLCPPVILQRPKGHNEVPPLEIPDERWFELVLKHANLKTRACILVLTLHGMRVSEAIERTKDDLDTTKWTLKVPHTKNGEPAFIRLSEPVIDAIRRMMQHKDWKKQKWLFGSCHRSNLHKRIKDACMRAEEEIKAENPDANVKVFGSHAYGRHSFASRLLNEGFSLKFVQDAGRWKTSKMVAERYGHLEQSEVEKEANATGERWARGVTGKRVKVIASN